MTIQTGRQPSAVAPTSGGLRGALTSVRTRAWAAPRIRTRPWAAAGICVDSGNRAGLIGHDNTHFLTRLGYNRQRPWAVRLGPAGEPERLDRQAVGTRSRTAARVWARSWAATGIRTRSRAPAGIRVDPGNCAGRIRHHNPHLLPGFSHHGDRSGAGLRSGNIEAERV